MNDDLERELRDVLDDRAREASTAARIPQRLVRRARRRQAATVGVSLVTVVAVASLAFSGLRMLDTDGLPALPADVSPYDSGRYPVFDRDVRIESFAVQSPSDWYLVNQWPLGARLGMQSGLDASCGPVAPSDSFGLYACTTPSASPSGVPETGPLPVLQLSNRDFGLDRPACGIGSIPPIEMTGDDVVVEVLIGPAPAGSVTARLEPKSPLELGDLGEQRDDGVCGPGTYLEFGGSSGDPYVVWASFGPDTSDEDREVALDAISLANGGAIGEPTSPSPAYVLAGTDTWRLELRPSTQGKNPNVDLSLVGSFPGGSAGNFTVPAVPLEDCCNYFDSEDEPLGKNPIRFGAVTKEASGVELRPREGDSIAGTLVPLPPSLSVFPFDLFFVDSPGTEHHRVVALGLPDESGTEPAPTDPPGDPSQTPSSSPSTAEPQRIVESESLSTSWALDYIADGQLVLGGNGDDILYARIGPEAFATLDRDVVAFETHTFGSAGEEQETIVFGVASSDIVNQIELLLSDGRGVSIPPEGAMVSLGDGDGDGDGAGASRMGPKIWWVVIAGSVHGQILALDTDCDQIFEAPIETDTPVPTLTSPPPSPEIPCEGP